MASSSTPLQSHHPWSLAIGRVAGIQLEVHVTFAVLFGWVAMVMIDRGHEWSEAIYALGLIVAAFVTIFLHELGHALTARAFGIRTLDIQLTPMGGMSNLEKHAEKPRHELLIALAGPAVSLAIAGALFLVVRASGKSMAFADLRSLDADPLSQLMWLNLVVALYNLLPIFPMDGGRALRAGLSFVMAYPKATRITARLAQLGSIPLALAGAKGNLIYVLTAVWIWMSAERELKDVRTRATLQAFSIRDVMVKDPVTLQLDDTLKVAASTFVSTFQSEFPVMQGDSVAGVIGFDELIEGLATRGETAAVREAMRRDPEGVDIDSQPADALQRLRELEEDTDHVLMVLERDRLVGVLPTSNLKQLLKVEKALRRA